MITIELPWPDAKLNPNNRTHRIKKNVVAQEAKEYAYYMTLSYRFGQWNENETITATYTFYPPDDYRKRDTDNFLSSCKPYQDGICKALDIDDSSIRRTIIEWGDVIDGGLVKVTLEPME